MDKFEASIDWLNIVVHSLDVMSLLDDLAKIDSDFSFDSFDLNENKGLYNYRVSLVHKLCPLKICWNPLSYFLEGPSSPYFACSPAESNNPFVFFSFSGDALRFFRRNNKLSEVFQLFGKIGCRASRFDIALDLFEDNPVIGLLQEACRYSINACVGKPTFKTKLNRTKPDNFLLHECVDPDFVHPDFPDDGRFWNVTLGNHSSSFGMFRMYNKLFEVKYGRLSSLADDYLSAKGLTRTSFWYRLEYELHKERADQVFQLLLSDLVTSDDCFLSAFLSVASTMFTPVDLSSFSGLQNQSVCPVWEQFFDELRKSIHFVELGSIPYIPHNSLPKFEKHLLNLSGYIYAAIEYLSSCDRFREEFYRSGRVKYETLSRYEYIRRGVNDLKGGELDEI